MKPQQALQIIKQIAEALHKQGSVQVTPEAYEKLAEAIKVIEGEIKNKSKKAG
jgi:uncharacterized Zn finger protein